MSRDLRRSEAGERMMATRNPLEGLNTRLTYRTMRVLRLIASRPGLSNVEIAEGAGVRDQGQISKLLARLCRLGLLENAAAGQPKGVSYAWRLSTRGREVERAIARDVAATWPSDGRDAST